MGSFQGHALPGCFFLTFGLWWMVNVLHRYYKARRVNKAFISSATFVCPFLCGKLKRWPLEGYLKIISCSVGIIGELIAGTHGGKFLYYGDGQHATMYMCFALSGILDVLIHHGVPLPPDLDYVTLAMAFGCEGLLFKFHLHGRSELDVLLHTILLYVIAAGVAACLLEMLFRHYVLVALLRATSMVLQGTWFLQIGWIMYHPVESSEKWDQHDHDQMTLATMLFIWHAACCFVFMLLLGGMVSCLQTRCCKSACADNMHVVLKTFNKKGWNGFEETGSDDNDCNTDSDPERHTLL